MDGILITFLLSSLVSIGFVIGACVKNRAVIKFANKNGYQEANAIYKQLEIDELEKQLASNQISAKEFNSKINRVNDLSVDYYMTGDSISQEVKDEYIILKNKAKAFEYVEYSAPGIVLAEAVTYAVLSKVENKRNQKAAKEN